MRKAIALLVFTVLICFSCNRTSKKDIDTGRIEYRITYLETVEGGFDPTLLPKKMVLEFNPNNCINTIQGFMGVFQLSSYIEFSKRKAKTHLKVFGEHYLYQGSKNELMCCFDPLNDITYEAESETKVIAGLNSKKVSINSSAFNKPVEIYYTNDINLPHANANNPYSFIDGVLTYFVLTTNGYTMQFEAVKYTPGVSGKTKFELPGKYKEVNQEQLNYIFGRLLSSKN